MTLDGETRIFSRHAGAVVADFDEFLAAGFEDDVDGPGPGVDRVFDQLLDDRGRPLHDLARRNLVDQLRGKDADGGHWRILREWPVAGCQWPVAGCQWPVAGYQWPAASGQWPEEDHRHSGHRLL